MVDVRLAGRLGDLLDAVAGLLLGADEQHGAAAAGEPVGEALRLAEQRLGAQQVDDVDAAALAVDEAAHLRIPAARLVAEVHAGLQQLPDPDFLSHGCFSLAVGCAVPGRRGMRNPGASCAGQGPQPQDGLGRPGSMGQNEARLGRGVRGFRIDERIRARYRGRRALGLVRVGPPFPYLRWTGPLHPPPPARSAAARSAGSGERTSTGSPVDRVREREPRGVQELAREPVAAGRAVLRVARDRVADRQQVRADLVRAAGLEPHAQQRVVRQRALDLEVRDRLARLVGVGRDRACARGGRGRAARRSCRGAPAGGPRRARGTRARGRAARAPP